MKLKAILFILNFTMIWCLCAIAWPGARADEPQPTPAWMSATDSMSDVEKPAGLSADDQEQCVGVVLGELNARLGTSFRRENVAPIQMAGWDKPEVGFVRGGGFNIRVVTTLPVEDASQVHVSPGRFADFWTFIDAGLRPSLHVPGSFDGQTTFNQTWSDDGKTVSYDFVAHTDSAYAYLPFGFIFHEIRDVFGANSRPPCPLEGDVDPENE